MTDVGRIGGYGFRLRSESGEGPLILAGKLLSFGEWNEIRSSREGHFMESVAPGAFDRTLSEQAGRLQVLFDHGEDPSIGRKPLGRVRSINAGAYDVSYEVELLDAEYVRGLLPGLRAGLYGASFNFRPVRERTTSFPKRSERNPEGLPERVLQEVEMREFGPTPFPVYRGTSAGLRSLDELPPVADERPPPRSRLARQPALVARSTWWLPEGHIDSDKPWALGREAAWVRRSRRSSKNAPAAVPVPFANGSFRVQKTVNVDGHRLTEGDVVRGDLAEEIFMAFPEVLQPVRVSDTKRDKES